MTSLVLCSSVLSRVISEFAFGFLWGLTFSWVICSLLVFSCEASREAGPCPQSVPSLQEREKGFSVLVIDEVEIQTLEGLLLLVLCTSCVRSFCHGTAETFTMLLKCCLFSGGSGASGLIPFTTRKGNRPTRLLDYPPPPKQDCLHFSNFIDTNILSKCDLLINVTDRC